MPSTKAAPSPRAKPEIATASLARALGASGQEEYESLLRVLHAARGYFALMPIESDFRPALRDALLQRLRADLAEEGVALRVVRLTREVWDVTACLKGEAASEPEVVAVIGLEDTPGIVPEPGAAPRRPPAIATLNHAREMLRKRLNAPLLVWCDPLTYTALQEHAPDFFDHYTALFTFLDYEPESLSVEPLYLPFDKPGLFADLHRPDMLSRAAVTFYEEQVEQLKEPGIARARALLGLAQALWNLRDAHNLAGPPRAKESLEQALKLLSPENYPIDWARATILLGKMIEHSPTGKSETNIRQSIACFQSVLRIVNEVEFPQIWAAANLSLAHSYRQLPTGSRRKNIRQAIECYEAALRVYTETAFPLIWALIQVDLAMAYKDFPSDDRKENLQQSIRYFESALRTITEDVDPPMWAMIQLALGDAYDQLSKVTQAQSGDNIRRAITCYQAALRVYTEAEFPQDWAVTQTLLGLCYYKLPIGDRLLNLQQAIEHYDGALRILNEVSSPDPWVETLYLLGRALLERAKLTHSGDNLLHARQCFNLVANHYNRTPSHKRGKHAAEIVKQIDATLSTEEAQLVKP